MILLYLWEISQPSENCLIDFCNVYNLSNLYVYNLVKETTCFKNPDNPSCRDLFLTNRPKCFQSTMRMETGILDFHKMIITNNQELPETFTTFFSNITQNLKIDNNFIVITQNLNTSDSVLKGMKKYEKHPRIIKIKKKMKNKNMSFSFSFVTKKKNLLRKLNLKKAYQESDILVKIIKENLDIVSNFVYNNINNSPFSSNFPIILKKMATERSFLKRKTEPTLRIIILIYRKNMKVYVHSNF